MRNNHNNKKSILIYCLASSALVCDGGNMAAAADVEEIVVTAQKRSENIQDVPLTVQAWGSETLKTSGIESTLDLPRLSTGLVVSFAGNAARMKIRGIGNSNFTPGDESSVAVYIDGIYMPIFEAGIFNFNNIERIEVLKGPQGTLFGRNAVGGVINVITKTPQYEPSAEISVGYGNYDSKEASFYGTAGLGSKMAMDLAVSYDDSQGGWGKNLVDGKPTYIFRDISVRSRLLLEPTESLRVILSGDWSRAKNDRGNSRRVSSHTVPFDRSPYPGFYNTNADFYRQGTSEQRGAALSIGYEWSWARLLSLTSIRKFDVAENIDRDWTPTNFGAVMPRIKAESKTQELQFLSPEDSKLSWVIGMFYIKAESGYFPLRTIGRAVPIAGGSIIVSSLLKTDSISGYGEVTAPVFAGTNLTAGLRYTTDERYIATSSNLLSASGALVRILSPFSTNKVRYGNWTYKVAIDHHFNDSIMAYLSHSTGFKSGTFVASSATTPPVRPEKMTAFEAGLKTELFDRRARLNFSAFHYDIKDLQVFFVPPGSVLNSLVNAAKARVKGVEAELDWSVTSDFRLSGGIAWLDAKFRDYPGVLIRVPPPPGFVDASGFSPWQVVPNVNAAGFRLQDAPEWTANLTAKYNVETRAGTWQPSLGFEYRSRVMGSSSYPENVTTEGRVLFDAALRWESPDKNLWAQAWVKNAFDRKWVATAFALAELGLGQRPGAPRTYGLRIGARFGK